MHSRLCYTLEQFENKHRSNGLLGHKYNKERNNKISKTMAGRTFSDTHLKNLSIAKIGLLFSKKHCDHLSKSIVQSYINNDRKSYTSKSGFRKDLKKFFRSASEANFARYLNKLHISWIYEPEWFKLSNNKHYCPDFYLPEFDMYIEIKGFLQQDDIDKMNLFKNNYPNKYLKLLLCASNEFKNIKLFCKNNVEYAEAC